MRQRHSQIIYRDETMCKKEFNLFIILQLIITAVVATDKNNDPIVRIQEGKLRGVGGKLVDGSQYYSFKGIPYATPPLGNLRFKAPLPPRPWEGVRDASKFGSICTQYNSTIKAAVGEEDCLFLNVYTKTLNKSDQIPVMVYIFGGAFSEGSGDFFLGDFLLQHEVILVTFNYRLELLGFLSLENEEVPGNAAMKDQVAALKWVKNNIQFFGGNPKSVTLFGESAGASAATYHMFSRMSRGLFHRVIAQSGVAIHDVAVDARARAFRAGKILGIDTTSEKELLDYLRKLDDKRLVNLTVATLTPDEMLRGPPAQFVPVIEKRIRNVEAFISEHPVKMLVENKINKVPLMIGYNSAEGLIAVNFQATLLDIYNKEPSYYIPKEVVDRVTPEQLRNIGDRIKKFYVGNGNFTIDDLDTISDLITDLHFSYPDHRFVNLYASLYETIYMYRFNFVTKLNVVKIALGHSKLKGVCHADDLFYLFYNYLNEELYKTDEQLRDIVFKVTKLWTDFAKTGRPTPSDYFGVIWKPYTKQGKEYFNIEEPFSMGNYADGRRMELWNSIYAEAGLPNISN
nr:acetylcholinesterase-like [Danaus plexippus plexippus]